MARGDRFINQLKQKITIKEVSCVIEDQIVVDIDRNDLPEAVKILYYDMGGWLSNMVANDEREINGYFTLYYTLSMEGAKMAIDDELPQDEKCWITIRAYIPPTDLHYPSVTKKVPAAAWYEREAYDMFGLVAEGLPDSRRLVLSDDWPENLYPLRKNTVDYTYGYDPVPSKNKPNYKFMEPEIVGVMDEPSYFKLYVDGETILDADYRPSYQHRGMEKLAENRINYNQMGFLAERVYGICGFAHSIACIEAIERASNIKVPLRAQTIRVVCLEIERLHSNLLNIGFACEVTGNNVAFMHILKVQKYTVQLAQLVTGGRKIYGNVMIGGIRRDITAKESKKAIELVNKIYKYTKEVWESIMENENQINRWKGIGIFDKKVARDFSAVGPNIRGSGFKRDTRYDHPYDILEKIDFEVSVENGCDVLSRKIVRYKDMIESLNIIKQCIEMMPDGAIFIKPQNIIEPYAFAIGNTEAPRGENIHWVMQGSAQKVYRWRYRTAIYNNWPSLRYQLQENDISDIALIVCSLDPCCSYMNRFTVVDVKTKRTKIVTQAELNRYCQNLKKSPLKK